MVFWTLRLWSVVLCVENVFFFLLTVLIIWQIGKNIPNYPATKTIVHFSPNLKISLHTSSQGFLGRYSNAFFRNNNILTSIKSHECNLVKFPPEALSRFCRSLYRNFGPSEIRTSFTQDASDDNSWTNTVWSMIDITGIILVSRKTSHWQPLKKRALQLKCNNGTKYKKDRCYEYFFSFFPPHIKVHLSNLIT